MGSKEKFEKSFRSSQFERDERSIDNLPRPNVDETQQAKQVKRR